VILCVCCRSSAFSPACFTAPALLVLNLIPAKVRGAERLGAQRARAPQRQGALGKLHEVAAGACGRCARAVQAAGNVTAALQLKSAAEVMLARLEQRQVALNAVGDVAPLTSVQDKLLDIVGSLQQQVQLLAEGRH
jgi:hypothetical protein